jgi:hypothetical protein
VISPQRETGRYRIATDRFDLEELEKDPLRALGLVLYRPRLPAVVGRVLPGSAAELAGFRESDRVLSIDGKADRPMGGIGGHGAQCGGTTAEIRGGARWPVGRTGGNTAPV